jgi:uncharacterized membrane protein
VLVLAALALLVINVYFTALILGRWPRLRQLLSRFLTACRADTSSCAVVARTSYARMVGGIPNVSVGIPWALAVLALGLVWMVTGRAVVPWPFLVVAGLTVVAAVYLIYALRVVLRQPCPL